MVILMVIVMIMVTASTMLVMINGDMSNGTPNVSIPQVSIPQAPLSVPITAGFKQMAFSCEIQIPYNMGLTDRFGFDVDTGVYNMWVLATDKPYLPGNPTLPRSELRLAGVDYTSGVWQFEGDFFVASPITGICIMQVFGGTNSTATALQLHIMNGTLVRSGGNLPSSNIIDGVYDRWVHLNVIHDADQGNIQIYVDRILQYYEDNASYKTHYFKCGSAYTQKNPSPCLESRWKNIAVWKKPGQALKEDVRTAVATTAACFPQ